VGKEMEESLRSLQSLTMNIFFVCQCVNNCRTLAECCNGVKLRCNDELLNPRSVRLRLKALKFYK
jgi:hypothetical protein